MLFPRLFPRLAALVPVAALSLAVVQPAPAASLDEGVKAYRAKLVADVESTLSSARRLAATAAAGDLAAAKQAWLDARVGWERSEVFTTGFVPGLDRDIDAWPNGVIGFHAIEAKLFGAGRTDCEAEADGLVRNLQELNAKANDLPLTAQGLLDGVVRLAYEVGESKVDGGESRLSGSSLADMRNNVDGIDLAWQSIFAPAVEARDPAAQLAVRRSVDAVRTLVAAPELRRVDPDSLRAATEELVLRLQNAAPVLDLGKPALETDNIH